MKRLIALSILFTMLLSSAAFGARRDFGKFTVDVPKGWKTEDFRPKVWSENEYNPKYDSCIMMTKGRMEMKIEVGSRDGESLEAVAREIAAHYSSEDCEDMEDEYIFTYMEDGVKGFGRVSEPKRGMYLFVLITPHEHDNDVMFDIEESIRVK